jgi:hypothetical protein
MKARDEEDLARKIASRLDLGTSALRQGTAYRLQSARQAAMARMNELSQGTTTPLTQQSGVLAGSAGTLGDNGGRTKSWLTDYRLWLAVVAIAGGMYFYNYWTILQQASEIAELDSALLGADIPFDALFDKGFENWLNRSSQ